MKKEKIVSLLKILTLLLLFGTFFLRFLSVPLWDGDFWWHISTGRYIVLTGSLPDKDPFSFTSDLEENKNRLPEIEKFKLKQNWLSQIGFYLIYNYTGPKGIIILRSILLTLTLLVVFWRLRRWSVSIPFSFIFVFALFDSLLSFLGERPVLFTIFLSALLIFIMEDFKDKRDNRIFLLLPLMLLWSNLHGGFILGLIIIVCFLFGEGAEIALKRIAYSKREIVLFYTAAVAAIGLSYINPTGWDAFSVILSSQYKAAAKNIQEYQSPIYLYKNKISLIHYGYASLALIFPIILIVRNRRLSLTHIILLTGSLIMSISAMRYIVFYAVIASTVIGRELDILLKDIIIRRFPETTYTKTINGLSIAVLFSILFHIAGVQQRKVTNIADLSAPVKAVDFIEKNRLKGNMFNEDRSGGYIAWRLYPYKKNFMDTRSLNCTVVTEYDYIINALNFSDNVNKSISNNSPFWEMLLNHYKINFIILSLLDRFGQTIPLIFGLAENSGWAPVYCDNISVIFVKNIDLNKDVIKISRLTKDDIYNKIVYRAASNQLLNPGNPKNFISLGETFYRMGRLKDSLTAYKYAFERMPDPIIQENIRQIESKMKKKEERM